MTTIALNLKDEIRDFLYSQVEYGNTPSIEGFIEDAIASYRANLKRQEDQLCADVLEAEAEVRSGNILRGNFRDLLKNYQNE